MLLAGALLAGCRQAGWPPELQEVPPTSPPLTPEQALQTFFLPPGYAVELVAAEPLVVDPVAIDFDADGRLWVAEMTSYMPNIEGEGEDAPTGRIAVLEDVDDDGRMDRRTVYLDSLVLPRAVKVLREGVLVATPPNLWLTRDVDGDLRADTRDLVRDDYGNPESNPEHNANGLLWGMDNWIHNAKYDAEFRLRDGAWEHRVVPGRGQWGVSMDDYGRLYRNSNSDPLRVDLVPGHYLARNPDLPRTRGVYEDLVEDETVWPVRPTRGVNRGYREGVLREDGRLRTFTAAGSPVVYRGDRLPEELRGDVFVTESSGNLVRRFEVREDERGMLHARNAYEGAEFLASTDERFRPVNLATAPDGTLYVVDMYRGIIQHRRYVTGYLETQIRARGLEEPLGLGRIYRVVHTSTERGERPALSERSTAGLVDVLAHPNGWWRDTAQRLLVERGDRSVVPALRTLVREADDARTRLHALWTLEGLGAADVPTLVAALDDASPHVRAAAVRIAEPALAAGEHDGLRAAVLARAGDADPAVRRQLAASLGVLPAGARVAHLADLLAEHGDDPVLVDAGLSGLRGHEMALLGRLLEAETPGGGRAEAVAAAAATVMGRGDAADRHRLFAWIGASTRPQWQRLALLDGVAAVAPEPDDDGEHRPLRLERAPSGLLAAASEGDEELRIRAASLADRLTWPGKPAPRRPDVRPLTAEERARFEAGRERYAAVCAACHQEDGRGLPGVAKPLAGSSWVTGSPKQLVRIVLHGKDGEMLMPPVGSLSDEEVAAILTYVRRAWGNEADPVSAGYVREIRGQTTGRQEPWTEEELRAVR